MGVISLTCLFFPLQEVRNTTVAFLLLRIPTLKIKVLSKKEVFEANLKTECDLWHLMVKEMWAGKKLADDHKVWGPVCLFILTQGSCLYNNAQHKAGWDWGLGLGLGLGSTELDEVSSEGIKDAAVHVTQCKALGCKALGLGGRPGGKHKGWQGGVGGLWE